MSRLTLPVLSSGSRVCRPLSVLPFRSLHSSPRKNTSSTPPPTRRPDPTLPEKSSALRENIYTIPNLLTVSRMIACPVLGLAVVNDNFYLATGLLVYAGLTDLVCLSSLPVLRLFPLELVCLF